MPAIITHHLFGEDASALMPQGIIDGQEELLAFLLGNQGTDPFWARVRTTPNVARTCHELATRVHGGNTCQTLMALRNAVARLRKDDMSVGRAFVLGIAAHFVLDCMTHPLVHAQQIALTAVDPSLNEARGEIHAMFESDLDSWMLWEKRQQTVLDTPCASALARTSRIERVAGALLSQMAWEVFSLDLGAAEYGRAVADYQLMYHLIDPPAHVVPTLLTRLELAWRPYSRLGAQAHPAVVQEDCPAANLEHHLWRDPYTNDASTASFPDLFHDALMVWPMFSRRLVEGDELRLQAMIANVNHYGCPA